MAELVTSESRRYLHGIQNTIISDDDTGVALNVIPADNQLALLESATVTGTLTAYGDFIVSGLAGGAAYSTLPASNVTVVPTGSISSTDAQAALAELDAEKAQLAGTLTNQRVPFANASGFLTDNANLFYVAGTGLRVTDATASSSTTTGALVVTGGIATGDGMYAGGTVRFTNSTASTSTSTGALVVTGGVGVGGAIYSGGACRFTNSTASTSTTTGALVVTGGVGIGGAIYSGGSCRFTNSTASTSTTTGALVVTGGVGIGGSLYATSGTVVTGGIRATAPKVSAGANAMWMDFPSTAGRFAVVGPNPSTFAGFEFNQYSSDLSLFRAPLVLAASGEWTVFTTTASSSTTSGALVVTGGVGCGDYFTGKYRSSDGTAGLTATRTFYAASTSGGATNVLNTVTIKDGIITSWTQA